MSIPTKIYLDVGFASFELQDDFLMGTVKEAVLFGELHLAQIHEIFDEHYLNRPFCYISNRRYDYTIDPTCYLKVADYPDHLLAIAVLCYSDVSYQNAVFAKQFIKRRLEVFRSFDDCVSWINQVIKEANQ